LFLPIELTFRNGKDAALSETIIILRPLFCRNGSVLKFYFGDLLGLGNNYL